MNKAQIFESVQNIFRDIFDDESLIIRENTNASEIEEWDSLNHITLISAIEKKFGIKFALGELESLKDVGAMIDLMQDKIKSI